MRGRNAPELAVRSACASSHAMCGSKLPAWSQSGTTFEIVTVRKDVDVAETETSVLCRLYPDRRIDFTVRIIQLGLFSNDPSFQDGHVQRHESAIVPASFDTGSKDPICHGYDILGSEIDGARVARAGHLDLNHTLAWSVRLKVAR